MIYFLYSVKKFMAHFTSVSTKKVKKNIMTVCKVIKLSRVLDNTASKDNVKPTLVVSQAHPS